MIELKKWQEDDIRMMRKEIVLSDLIALMDAETVIKVEDDMGNCVFCGFCELNNNNLIKYANRAVTYVGEFKHTNGTSGVRIGLQVYIKIGGILK